MMWLLLIRKYWEPILGVITGLVIVSTIWWVSVVVKERDSLRIDVMELNLVIERYRANEVTAEMLNLQVAECLQRVADAQGESDAWQERYNELKERVPVTRVVEVPVEVAAPGTPCEEAVAQVAEWLRGEVHHDG